MRRFAVLYQHQATRQLAYKIMAEDLLKPPVLETMTKLDKAAFKKTVTVPCLKIKPLAMEPVKKLLKSSALKLPRLKPLIQKPDEFLYLLNPYKVSKWTSLEETVRDKLMEIGITDLDLTATEVELSYENWNADDIMRSVLPKDLEIARGFSQIGHIIHLNLREHHLKHKQLIAEILLDKIPNAKTVVNKTTGIDNTFRNFQMEVICGDANMITQVKENGIVYEFDFSKVYWNSRLSTEHERIVNLIKPGDALFDVFCGVGPFALPCAKKKCKVFANDLNPDSYTWLNSNIKRNKINSSFIQTFNKDGKDFITGDLKEQWKTLTTEKFSGKIHITMNLPALALEFIKYFRNLFYKDELADNELLIPTIHVYFFVFGLNPEETAKNEFEKFSGLLFDDDSMRYQYVRNVSPKKDMVKISFNAPVEFFVSEEPPSKKICNESR